MSGVAHSSGLKGKGFRFEVHGLRFGSYRAYSLRIEWGLGFEIYGVGFRVCALGFEVPCLGLGLTASAWRRAVGL